MNTTAAPDLLLRVRNQDRTALSSLLLAAEIHESWGPDFIFAYINQFHGSTINDFLSWAKGVLAQAFPAWLLARLKAGDHALWNYWLDKHRGALRRWTDSRVGISPGHGGDASDVVNAGLMDLIKTIPDSITTYDQFLAWVRTTLRRRAIDLSRRRLLRGFTEDSFILHNAIVPYVTAEDSTASQKAISREREERILACAAEVDSGDLLVLLLRQNHGCHLAAVARGTERTLVEVGKAYYRAFVACHQAFDEFDVGAWPEEQDTDRERLLRRMQRLSVEQRLAIELKHLDDFTLWEIAQVLGYIDEKDAPPDAARKKRVESAVGALLYRGMKALRRSGGP
jgi:RNA polymerase sigma factor (sigma-70 family)